MYYNSIGYYFITLPAVLIAVSHQASWYEADKYCTDDHSRLPKQEDIKSSDVDRIFGNVSTIWLGGKFVHTQWTWIDGDLLYNHVGCFDTPTNQLNPRKESCLETMDCFRVCTTPYIALQTNSCYCLPDVSGYRKRSSSECPYRCWNNFNESCGGLSALSVYSRDMTVFPWSQYPYRLFNDCAYLIHPLSTSPSLDLVTMETDQCGAQSVLRRPFFHKTCKNCPPEKVGIYVTWQQARHYHNFSLARVTKKDNPLFDATLEQYYWIGLYRHPSLWKWTDHSRMIHRNFFGRESGNITHCIAGQCESNGTIIMTSLPCSTSLKYVCISDLLTSVLPAITEKSTFTLQSASSSPSPPTSSSTSSPSPTFSTSSSSTKWFNLTALPTTSKTAVSRLTLSLRQTSTYLSSASSTATSVKPSAVSKTAAFSQTRYLQNATTSATSGHKKTATTTNVKRDTTTSVVNSGYTENSTDTRTMISATNTDSTTTTTETRPMTTTTKQTKSVFVGNSKTQKSISPADPRTSTRSFVFITRETTASVSRAITQMPTKDDTSKEDLYIALAVIGGLALIIICVIVTVGVIRRRRIRNRSMLYNVNVPASDDSDVWTNNSQLIVMDNSIYGKTQKRVRIRSLRDLISSSQSKTSSLHSLVPRGENSDQKISATASRSLRASSGAPDPFRPLPFEPDVKENK